MIIKKKKVHSSIEQQYLSATAKKVNYMRVFNLAEPCKSSEPCHLKTGCKIFVVVITKEGWAGTIPAKPSFGMTMTMTDCINIGPTL